MNPSHVGGITFTMPTSDATGFRTCGPAIEKETYAPPLILPAMGYILNLDICMDGVVNTNLVLAYLSYLSLEGRVQSSRFGRGSGRLA